MRLSSQLGHATAFVQVATYHYDIKRMDDQRADGRGSLQVIRTHSSAAVQAVGLHGHPQRSGPLLFRAQVIGGDLDVTMPMAPPSGIQAFKAFLVQVGSRAPELHVERRSAWARCQNLPGSVPPCLTNWPNAGAVHVLAAHGAGALVPPQRHLGQGGERASLSCLVLVAMQRCIPVTPSCPWPLGSQVSAGILHHVALGLQYLHSKGIIHGGASALRSGRARCALAEFM